MSILFLSHCQEDFYLTNCRLSFNVLFRDGDMWRLVFELINAFIHFDDRTSDSRFNQPKTRKQPTASDQTIKSFATLLIEDISSLARTYFQVWYIANGPPLSKSHY